MYKKCLAFFMVLILAVSIVACAEKPKTEFNISTFRETVHTTALHIIMRDFALVEKYVPDGVAVNWSVIPSVEDERDALVSGTIDLALIASSTFITAYENGMAFVPLSGAADGTSTSLYSCRDDIASIEQLAKSANTDKIASVSAIGNVSHLAFMVACEEILGDARFFDDKMVGMSLSDVLASAEASNELAGAVIGLSPGVDYGELSLILDLTEYTSKYCLNPISAVTEDFYKKNPALVNAFYQAQDDALDIIRNRPDEAATVLQKYWDGCTIEEIKQIMLVSPPIKELSETAYDNLANFLYEIELIPNVPKPFSTFPNYADIPKAD